ncbi:MAG: nickel-dependent hydrogenase large subunit, partial [Proteobacteria bacterium]|nr:nickel-dependent hydrogenase large subunit [Pseudomonadota bacterium]
GKAFSLHSSLDVNYSNLEKLINELQQYLQKYVFSIQPLDWLEQKDLAATMHWFEHSNTIASQAVSHIYNNGWSAQGKCNCRHLPDLNGRQLLEQFDKDNSDHFIARPQWQQHCFETTVLSRQASQTLIQSLFQNFQNSLLTRWLARLVDLAKIPQQLGILMKNLEMQSMHMSSSQYQNLGLAQVETARGRLIHRVEIKHGLISKYQILAPTEWNFHPQGVVAQSLAGLKTNNRKELEQLARLIINAIDPCVGYKLRIH